MSLLCGIVNLNASILLSIGSLCNPGYVVKDWHVLLTIYVLVVSQAALNIFAFKFMPKIQTVASVVYVLLFIAFLSVFGAMGEKHSAAYAWTHFEVSSGWGNKFVSWNVGMLSAVWACESITQFTSTPEPH